MNRHHESDLGQLQAGAARVMITPSAGIRMWGYTAQECVAEGCERELTATALVLAVSGAKTVLIGCDLLMIQNPAVDRIRQLIADRLGVSAECILINASHTHLGPMLPGWQEDSPEQQKLQQDYLSFLEESLVAVSVDADRHLQPARIGSSTGHVELGINRRERLDGRIIIGNNAEGPIDRCVDVIRIDSISGEPLATIYSAAAHPIVLGFNTSQLSPDFVGPARELIEAETGALSVFLQAAAGNISPSCGVGTGGQDQQDNQTRLGVMLGGEVVKVWVQIRTHNRLGARRVVRSVAEVSSWDYEPLPAPQINRFRVAERRVTLPMAALPDRDDALQMVSAAHARLEDARRGGKTGEIHVAKRVVEHAELVLKTVDLGEQVSRQLIVWCFSINDLCIVAVNGEAFTELGLEVKDRSPLNHTLFLGYSNGCLGYFPTPEAFEEGGMEVDASVKNYRIPAAFTPQWGPTIVTTALDCLSEITASGTHQNDASGNRGALDSHPSSCSVRLEPTRISSVSVGTSTGDLKRSSVTRVRSV